MARRNPNTSTDVTVPGTEVPLSIFDLSANIVTELAAGLSDAPAIRQRYGISQAQWEVLKRVPAFREMLKEAIERLAGDVNAGARIKHKADIILEDGLSVLDEIAHDKDAQSMARIKALEFAAQLAGKGQAAQKVEGGGQGTFSLNIVIPGGGGVKIESDMTPVLEQQPNE